MTDHNIWTAETFLYDILLTQQAQTSGRRGSSPIDVYNSYLKRGVDIDTLCNLGADIMTIVEASGLEGIEPYFFKYWIWWRYRNQNIFGILICSKYPRLMFEKYWYEYLSEVYPEYESSPYKRIPAEVFKRDVTVRDLVGAFVDKLRDVVSEQDIELDDFTINWTER